MTSEEPPHRVPPCHLSYLIGLSNLGPLLRHVRMVGFICHGVCVVVGFIAINFFVLLLPPFLVLLVVLLLVVLSPCSSPLWSTTSFFFSSCDSEGSGGFSVVSGDVIVPIGGLSVNDRVEVDLGISTLRFSWIWAVSRALSNDSYINGR